MRFTSMALAATLALLQGCIYVENNGDGDWEDWDEWEDCGDDEWDPCWDDDFSDDEGDGTADDPAADAGLFLTPDSAAPGDILITSVRSADGFDLSSTVSVSLFGDVDVLATDAREGEVVITLAVWDDAREGALDLLIELDGGDTLYAPDAFTVIHTTGGNDGSGNDGSGDGSGDGCPNGDPADDCDCP